MTSRRVGLWLVGARGSVATTAVYGLLGLRAGVVAPTGCVTELPAFAGCRLPSWDDLVIGGHDIVDTPLDKRAEQLVAGGVIPAQVVAAVADAVPAVERELRCLPAPPPGPQARAVEELATHLTDFRERHGLATVVVVNVASTEPPAAPHLAHTDPDALLAALSGQEPLLPASSLAALAAITAGCPFVDFTPSTGARLPALDALARRAGVPYAGSDGKTGETLVKSALAPMFAARALRVRSWAGTNLLGGGDGATLGDPARAASKLASKSRVVSGLLGDDVTAPLHIDHVPDLGDWKTSWDHVAFEGFLGVRMTMQVTWAGCDSALAAPLVLDLARLTAAAHEAGESGPLAALAFFFKDPVASDEHRLAAQFDALVSWAHHRLGAGPAAAVPPVTEGPA